MMTGGRQESEVAMPKGDQLQVTVSPMELMKHAEVLLHSMQQAFERRLAAVTEQDRYMLALMGVAEFLDAIGAKELYGERFGKLAIAISDLESGRVAPVLSPRPFGKGRHMLDRMKTEIAKDDPQSVSRLVGRLLQRARGDTSSI